MCKERNMVPFLSYILGVSSTATYWQSPTPKDSYCIKLCPMDLRLWYMFLNKYCNTPLRFSTKEQRRWHQCHFLHPTSAILNSGSTWEEPEKQNSLYFWGLSWIHWIRSLEWCLSTKGYYKLQMVCFCFSKNVCLCLCIYVCMCLCDCMCISVYVSAWVYVVCICALM